MTRAVLPPVTAPPDAGRRAVLHALAASALVASGVARAQDRPEKTSVVMALGGKTTVYHLPLTIADQLGFFTDEGLDVELQDHAGGGLAQQSLLQGHADLAAGGFEHTLLPRQRAYSCQAFVQLGRAPQQVFGVSTRALPAFGALSQLQGRRVGISAPDSSTHWFARLVLARGGLTDADVEYVGVGTSTAAAAALREGRIDAIASIDPVISMLEFRGEIRVLADARSPRGTRELFGGPMPGGCLYAPQAFVVRHPKTVQALTNAAVRALKWLQTAGPSDLVRAVPEAYMYGDRAIYLASFEKARAAFSPDGVVADDAVATAHRVVAQHYGGASTARALAPGVTYTNDYARRAKQKFQIS